MKKIKLDKENGIVLTSQKEQESWQLKLLDIIQKGISFTKKGPLGGEFFTMNTEGYITIIRADKDTDTEYTSSLNPEQVAIFNAIFRARVQGDQERFDNSKVIFKECYRDEYKILALDEFKMDTEPPTYYRY